MGKPKLADWMHICVPDGIFDLFAHLRISALYRLWIIGDEYSC